MTRESIVEGIFYPADKDTLEKEITSLLESAASEPGKAEGILVPHAGYRYTGKTAAEAFRACSLRKVNLAVVISPVTRDPEDGIFLSDYDFFETPMGKIKTDRESAEALLKRGGRFVKDNFPFMEEHSIEVQLPFIQHLFPDAMLLPVHLGKQNSGTIRQLIKGLQELFGKREDILYVVSGNISGYLPEKGAKEQAEAFKELILENSHEKITEQLLTRNILPSCTGCMAAVMAMCGNVNISVLAESNSGDDKRVYYAAAALN